MAFSSGSIWHQSCGNSHNQSQKDISKTWTTLKLIYFETPKLTD